MGRVRLFWQEHVACSCCNRKHMCGGPLSHSCGFWEVLCLLTRVSSILTEEVCRRFAPVENKYLANVGIIAKNKQGQPESNKKDEPCDWVLRSHFIDWLLCWLHLFWGRSVDSLLTFGHLVTFWTWEWEAGETQTSKGLKPADTQLNDNILQHCHITRPWPSPVIFVRKSTLTIRGLLGREDFKYGFCFQKIQWMREGFSRSNFSTLGQIMHFTVWALHHDIWQVEIATDTQTILLYDLESFNTGSATLRIIQHVQGYFLFWILGWHNIYTMTSFLWAHVSVCLLLDDMAGRTL